MQHPPLLIQCSQLLQFSAQFHQLVLGSLDLRNKCFHSKLCQLGRKTDCCKSKCNHADSAKHIGFSFSLFKATSFYCKSFKSTFPKAFRRSRFISGSKILRECSNYGFNMVLSSKLRKHPRVTVVYQVLHISSFVKSSVYPHLVFSDFNSKVDGLRPPRRSSLKYGSHVLY